MKNTATITTVTVTALELRCEPEELLRAVETNCKVLLESGRCFATSVEYLYKEESTRIGRLSAPLILEVESETLSAEFVLDSALEQFLGSGEKVEQEESGAWSHRADLANWQNDFSSDFEETD